MTFKGSPPPKSKSDRVVSGDNSKRRVDELLDLFAEIAKMDAMSETAVQNKLSEARKMWNESPHSSTRHLPADPGRTFETRKGEEGGSEASSDKMPSSLGMDKETNERDNNEVAVNNEERDEEEECADDENWELM